MKTLANITFIMCILGSTCIAQDWLPVTSGTTKNLNVIDFASSNIGYIAGDDSVLLKTQDGGITWNHLSYSGINFFPGSSNFVGLDFVNDTIGFLVVGPYTGAYKTINGGSTWTLMEIAGDFCYTNSLHFLDENNGFVGGSNCFSGESMHQMTNGTWTTSSISFINFNTSNMISDIDFRGNLGLASSMGGRILRSTDAGLTWDSIVSPYGNEVPLLSIAIINDTLCYAGYDYSDGGGFGLLRSHDAGLTWSQEFEMATFFYPDYYGIHLATDGNVYAGAKSYLQEDGLIFSKTDLGWNYEAVTQPIYNFSSHDESVYGVGKNGLIVVKNAPIAGINSIENNEEHFFVYPNPTTGKIALSKGFEANTQYKIISIDGKIIQKGTISPELDFSEIQVGTYFLRINNGNQFYTSTLIKQ